VQHAPQGGLQALVGVGDDQLGAAQAAPGRGAQEVGPEDVGLAGAVAMPRTSRRPSLLTPTAKVAATETIRPARRTRT
jgi:hypothetical protein